MIVSRSLGGHERIERSDAAIATDISGGERCGVTRGGTADCDFERDRCVCGGAPVVMFGVANNCVPPLRGCINGHRSSLSPPGLRCGSLPDEPASRAASPILRTQHNHQYRKQPQLRLRFDGFKIRIGKQDNPEKRRSCDSSLAPCSGAPIWMTLSFQLEIAIFQITRTELFQPALSSIPEFQPDFA